MLLRPRQLKSGKVSGPLIAWETEPFAITWRELGLILVKTAAASPQPFGPTECSRHAARCLAGEQTRVAWEERPATAAAIVPVSCGIGLVTTVTKTVNVKQSKVEREG
jgi:hypothetical protein